MVLIAVHGSASRFLPAECGTLRLRIALQHREQGVALREVTALHERLVAEAKSHVHAGVATWWGSDQVHASPRHVYDEDGTVYHLEYAADAGVRLKFRDFGALSRWVATVAAAKGVDVDGIDWAVTVQHRIVVEREVRLEALADARARAEAYAAAMGSAGVTLQTLWEPGLRPVTGGSSAEAFGGPRRTSGSRGHAELELRPDDIEITAAVTADFVTTP